MDTFEEADMVQRDWELKSVWHSNMQATPPVAIATNYGKNFVEQFKAERGVLLPVVHVRTPEQAVRNAQVRSRNSSTMFYDFSWDRLRLSITATAFGSSTTFIPQSTTFKHVTLQ